MLAFGLLVSLLQTATVFSYQLTPFKVHEVSVDSIGVEVNHRIYGGTEARQGQFPYMVFALFRKGTYLTQCSASLVKNDKVLLAAHCVEDRNLKPSDIIVVGGQADLMSYIKERLNTPYDKPINEGQFGVQERRAQSFAYHPNYNRETIEHDVAFIKLTKPFNLSPGNIETIPVSLEKIESIKTCTILGWGLTSGNRQNFKLNYAEGKQVKTTELGCEYKPDGPFICLVPDRRGICQGDSGSPLLCDGKVWGVASHFLSSKPDPNCGESLEEYYSELYADRDWIVSTMNSGHLSAVISFKSLILCAFAVVGFSYKI